MTLLLTIGIISLLIFVHELGHLLAAKAVGIPVARFSLGFGRVVWSRHWRGVEYCVSMIPLGGYVLPAIEDEEAFLAIPVRRRIVFSLGGPMANFVFAGLLLALNNCVADGFSWYGLVIEPWAQVATQTVAFVTALPSVFLHPSQLSGVVGIVSVGKSIVASGLLSTIRFAVLLNLNLAIFNLLPIAPLDGGKILCALLEKIHPKLARLHTGFAIAGLTLLLALMVYTTVLDVLRQVA